MPQASSGHGQPLTRRGKCGIKIYHVSQIDLSLDSFVIIEMFTLTFPDTQFGASYFQLASRRRLRLLSTSFDLLYAPRALSECGPEGLQ